MNGKRDTMLDSQEILDSLFFGPEPFFKTEVDAVKALFDDRTDQLVVLLSIFAARELKYITYKRGTQERLLSEMLEMCGGAVH